jgi:hypothetical protein
MVQLIEPRRLLLSWRPTPGKAHLDTWVRRFRDRMHVTCPWIVVVDVREPGRDRASEREQRNQWTDFVSLLTLDYVLACKDPEHELAIQALPMLSEKISGMRFWAVRLDCADIREWYLPHGSGYIQLWAEFPRWHFMPDIGDPYVNLFAENLELQIEHDCVRPIMQHVDDCAVCRGDAAAKHVVPADQGPWHQFKRLFKRRAGLP